MNLTQKDFNLPIMRINAHNASAILPTEKIEEISTFLPMNDSELILEEIAEQKETINSICRVYGVKYTNIAKKSGIVASTINRFMASSHPDNALSAITIKKIKRAFPLAKKQEFTQAEIAIVYALKELFEIVLGKREATKSRIIADFNHALESCQDEPGAILVLDALLAHIKDDELVQKQHTLQQMLSLSPPRLVSSRK